MPFALLDDQFHSNQKVIAAGLEGAGLYARSLSYCGDYLTDGYVPLGWATEIAKASIRRRVTDSRLWLEVQGGEIFVYEGENGESYTVIVPGPGFFIEDYLTLNPTRASATKKREELSAKRADAGRKGALARWQKAKQTDGKPMANDWQDDSPHPNPQSPSQKSESSSPAFTSYDGNGGDDLADAEDCNHALDLLIEACGNTDDARQKLTEDVARYGAPEARLVAIRWAVSQPGTKSALGKARSMLKERKAA